MKSTQDTFSLTKKIPGKLPRLPFRMMKEAVLGKKYVLSLVFVSPAESQKLNRSYRGKNKPTNVLSFSVSDTEGEIIICPTKAKKEAMEFGKTYKHMLGFLFIHGLLHLKGFAHSSKMENEERILCTRFHL